MPAYAGMFITTTGEDYTNGANGNTNAFGVGVNDKRLPMSYALLKITERLSAWYSPEELKDKYENVYKPQGIGVFPWGIPKGRSTQEAYQEGVLAGSLSAQVQGLFLNDLEDDHAVYWAGIEQSVHEFQRGLWDGGCREEWLCPDSRPDKLSGENFWVWWAYDWVTRVLPQAYSSIFYPNSPNGRQKRGIDYSTVALLDGGIPPEKIFPVLSTTDNDGNNPISGGELVEGIQYCHDKGFGGFFIWRRGYITQEQCDAMLNLNDPWNVPAIPKLGHDYVYQGKIGDTYKYEESFNFPEGGGPTDDVGLNVQHTTPVWNAETSSWEMTKSVLKTW